MLPNKIYEKLPNLKSVLETKLEDERPWDWLETRNKMLFPDKSKCSLAANLPPTTSFIGPCMPFLQGEESPVSTPFPLPFFIFSMSRFATRGGGVLPIMTYTGRLRPKGVPFSGFRYIKG